MTPKYYPISDLQTNNQSLMSVVSILGVDSLTAAELGNMVVNLKTFNRFCLRMSFFDIGFKKDIDFSDESNIKDNYLGFLVIRPLIKCIGRNVISPLAKVAPKNDIRICKVSVDASCLGVKLKAEGFPHASQDNETMTCAQTTIWSLLEYYGNKYTYYHPTLPTEIESILEPFSYERQLPSKGLTYNQISVALRNLGFGPKIYQTGKTTQVIR